MSDDALDVLVIGVGCGLGLGQHISRVEDVEPLVLHRPHVEVADRHDVEDVEIVFEAKDLFVPGHRHLQRGHRMAALVLVAAPHPDGECDLLARARREAVFDGDQIAGNESEEIGGFRVRIDPFGPMPPRIDRAAPDRVAVGEQHRAAALVGDHRRRVARHHVGPIDEIRDPAKAFGLALGTEIAARHV